MWKRIGAAAAGALTGGLVIAALEFVRLAVFPVPESVDLGDPASISAYLETAPAGALLAVLLAHALGALAAGATATLILRRNAMWPALAAGDVLLLLALINLLRIEHPLWFVVSDLLVFMPFAWLGYRLAARRTETMEPQS